MSFDTVPYPPSLERGDPGTQVTLRRLLAMRLTKFQLGFCLGLKDHSPTPEQQKILEKITNQYAAVWSQTEGKYATPRNGASADHTGSK